MTYIVTSTETIQVKKIGARILRPVRKVHK